MEVLLVETLEVGESGGEVYGGVLPMQEVGALHQDEAIVALPTHIGTHVGEHHVEGFAILGTQDVGVAHAALQGDGIRGYHGAAVVESMVVVAVVAQGVAHLLAVGPVAREVGKQVGGVLLCLHAECCGEAHR